MTVTSKMALARPWACGGGLRQVHRRWRHGAGQRKSVQGDRQGRPELTSAEDHRRAGERVQTLLAEPLSEDAAVQIALLNNRGLQAAYNDLGISEAEYVQTSLPPNPAVTVSRFRHGRVRRVRLPVDRQPAGGGDPAAADRDRQARVRGGALSCHRDDAQPARSMPVAPIFAPSPPSSGSPCSSSRARPPTLRRA